MQDYQPISLTDLCNVNAEIIGANATPTLGQQTFHGLPFHTAKGEKCFLGFGEGVNSDPIQIPVNASPLRVIFAHRLLESRIHGGGQHFSINIASLRDQRHGQDATIKQ